MLARSLPLLDEMLPTSGEEVINAWLEVFQMEWEREEEMVGEEEEEDHDEMDDIRASAIDQDEDMADEASRPQDPVGNALEILVKNATEEFGFSPGDVYQGVLALPEMRRAHAAVTRCLDYSELMTFVRMFYNERRLDNISDRVLSVHPRRISDKEDGWEIDFKSVRIRRDVESRMQLESDEHLRKVYVLFHNILEGSVLAGWIFKVIVHRILSDGCWGPTPQPIRMSKRGDPPTFSTSPTACSTSLPPPAPLRDDERTATQVDFRPSLPSGVTLDEGKYYTPATNNNPGFDSFTIDHDPVKHVVVISVFQITVSPSHQGSAQDYVFIRKIMSSVRHLLKRRGADARIEVTYFLVCPEAGSEREWQMPNGWSDEVDSNDHRGDAFCLRIPIATHRSAPCLFTPNFGTYS